MDHIFEQKLVRENHQLQFELAKLNKQIKQLQEKVVGYEQILSQLDEGERRNRRLAASLNKQGDRIRTGNTTLAAMDAHIKDVAKTQGGDAAQAADSALWRQRGQTSRGVDQAHVKAGRLETALNTGMAAVAKSRAARVARGSFSDKPKQQAQADRIRNIGGGIQTQQTQLSVQSTPRTYTAPSGGQNITMGTVAKIGTDSSTSLAAQGKLPVKKFGATPNQQKETLSTMRADSAAKREDRAAIQSYAAKARNKANKPA
jgi:myosin heavy subunit